MTARYDALSMSLLSAPDPVRAIAGELGDQAGRLDAVLRRVSHLEALVAALRDRPAVDSMAMEQEI